MFVCLTRPTAMLVYVIKTLECVLIVVPFSREAIAWLKLLYNQSKEVSTLAMFDAYFSTEGEKDVFITRLTCIRQCLSCLTPPGRPLADNCKLMAVFRRSGD